MAEPPKKIIFVVTKANWGGAQRYVYDLATALPQDRFAPLVVTGQGTELIEKLTAVGITYRQLPALGRDVKIFNDWKTFLSLYRLFKTEQPDIIHLNSSKTGGIGALAGRLARVPRVIFTAHGWAFNETRPIGQKIIIEFLSWLTILFCHRVIVINQKELNQVKNWPGVRQKIVLIYNGVKPIDFLPQAEARNELQKLLPALVNHPETVWVGTIAELHKNKGLIYLLQALKRLNLDCQGLTLTMIVIGEGEERKNLEQQIKNFGIENKFFLAGALPEAARYLKAFDIFILPSRKEGLPYTILEAGLAGLPVVASAVGGIPEIITSMESGILIRPREPQEIARALKFLIQEPKIRQRFGSALRRKVQSEFSTARMVKQTLAVYTTS